MKKPILFVYVCILVFLLVTLRFFSLKAEEVHQAPLFKFRVIQRLPHDTRAFTQGLLITDGLLIESTGKYGTSSLRVVKPESGDILGSVNLDEDLFGEGVTQWNNVLIQLTWKAGRALVYEKETLKKIKEFQYKGQGWGITSNGSQLIMSDGSNILYLRDPKNFTIKNKIEVYDGEKKITGLNELEYIQGLIFANIYPTDKIAAIASNSGKVLFFVDLSTLASFSSPRTRGKVPNGIAYNKKTGQLFVTGKEWPYLFEIEIINFDGGSISGEKLPSTLDE